MPLGSHHQRKQPSETRKGAESKKANEEAAEIKGAAACSATFAQDSNPPPPVAKDKSASPEVRPTPEKCRGKREMTEIAVETYSPNGAAQTSDMTTGKNAVVENKSDKSEKTAEVEKISFFSGNPFVEKTTGILHIYKRNEMSPMTEYGWRSEMLCMLGVPAMVTSRELLQFLAPVSDSVAQMRIIRQQTPNQYMVLIKFRDQDKADQFYIDFNGRQFNSIEPDMCRLAYVDRVEVIKESQQASLPVEGHTELPTCPVCLERMDESVDGILTILCNHSFHGDCLSQWGDTSCPVCRYYQTPEVTPDQKCFECGKSADLWICLICGHIGCGRYAQAHAYRHFESTSHTFTLQVGGERVWDYAGDNYVHRLIQSKTDGKVVEFEPTERHPEDLSSEEKMEAMQLEYTCLLTNQLENQRHYFEDRLGRTEDKLAKFEKLAQAQIEDVEHQLKRAVDECESLKKRLNSAVGEKTQAEKKQTTLNGKVQKLQQELNEERSINAMLRGEQAKWTDQVKHLETDLDSARNQSQREIRELQEQVRDLMFHMEAIEKVDEQTTEVGGVSKEEVQEGSLVVGEPAPNNAKRKSRKKR